MLEFARYHTFGTQHTDRTMYHIFFRANEWMSWRIGTCYLTYVFFSLKALMKAIEHELEVTVRVHEVRSEYERQMEEYVSFLKT